MLMGASGDHVGRHQVRPYRWWTPSLMRQPRGCLVAAAQQALAFAGHLDTMQWCGLGPNQRVNHADSLSHVRELVPTARLFVPATMLCKMQPLSQWADAVERCADC